MLRTTDRKRPPLGILWIALSLVVAAFLGATLGLVWQSSGFDENDGPAIAAETQEAEG